MNEANYLLNTESTTLRARPIEKTGPASETKKRGEPKKSTETKNTEKTRKTKKTKKPSHLTRADLYPASQIYYDHY